MNCMNGMESSLKNCTPEKSTCACGNHARLLCEPGIMKLPIHDVNKHIFIADRINGTPRVVGGSIDREGRVEVCVGGRWGTVQTNQSLEVAETVCRRQSQTLSFYSTSTSYG